MKGIFFKRMAAQALLIGAGSVAQAATVTLDAAYTGAYWTGTDNPAHPYFFSVGSDFLDFYTAGRIGQEESRGYLMFDLSGVTGTVTEATLRVFNPGNGFSSVDANETVRIAGLVWYSSLVYEVRSDGFYPWGYLGGELLSQPFATRTVSAADNDSLVDFTFNANAIAALNGAVAGDKKWLLLGISLTTLNEKPETGSAPQEYLFNQTDDDSYTRQLQLTTAVPEPSDWLLMTAGLGMLAVRLGRRPSTDG